LTKIKKLQEKYKKEIVLVQTTPVFSYNNPSQELLELDIFDRIILSFCFITRLVNKNKYKDYNS
jgi:hypothetical protein